MKKLFITALLSLLAVETHAAVVFEQPPSLAGGVMKSAWYPPDGLDGDAYVYDSFVLSSDQAITEIHWRGGYTNYLSGAGKSPVSDFTISIYASIPAGTQPDLGYLYTGPLVRYSVGGNAGEMPSVVAGGIQMYDYAFVLPTPFQAVAGTKYWIQIEASQGVTPTYGWPPDWGIAVGTGGDGTHFNAITGGTNGGGTLYAIMSGDAAFSLLTSAAATVNVTASASPANAGTVSGAGAYPNGSNASVSATPNAGFGFVNWTENGTPVSTSATYTFAATADRTLVANFTTAATITTSASPGNGGSTSGGGTFNSGSSVTVTATPAFGYAFVNWTEFGTEVSTSASYTFTAGTDRTLVANFALNSTSATFDFDTGTPAVAATQGMPASQTAGGVTAYFSAPPPSGAFSIQSDATTQYRLSQFSGNYLYPNGLTSNILEIKFSQPLTGISFIFATADFQQVEVPTTIQLNAYQDSSANPVLGSATAHGTYAGDTMPMGRLTYSSATPFNLVRIFIPYAPAAAPVFLMDHITVTTANVPPPPPQPGALQFAAASYSVAEANTSVTITVNRTGGSDGAVTVDYATLDGTAVAGRDYVLTVGTLSFAAGETSKSFSVPILTDTFVATNETVNLLLANPTGGATLGTPASAVLNIVDAPPPVRRQPDALIKLSRDALYIGNNVYSTDGTGQNRSLVTKSGKKYVFDLRVQNDGQTADGFVLKGDASASGFAVKYFTGTSGGSDITAAVVGGTYVLNNVAVGAVQTLRMEVTVASKAASGTTQSWLVTATSLNDPAAKDAVKATIRVK